MTTLQKRCSEKWKDNFGTKYFEDSISLWHWSKGHLYHQQNITDFIKGKCFHLTCIFKCHFAGNMNTAFLDSYLKWHSLPLLYPPHFTFYLKWKFEIPAAFSFPFHLRWLLQQPNVSSQESAMLPVEWAFRMLLGSHLFFNEAVKNPDNKIMHLNGIKILGRPLENFWKNIFTVKVQVILSLSENS